MTKRKNYYAIRLLLSLLLIFHSILLFSQSSYPVHVSVQALPPYSIYLNDYYSGSRDRLIVTLLNRDKQQRTLKVKLRMRIRNGSSFNLQSRDELYYPMLTLESGIPLRLTGADLAAYLSPDKITMQGRLNQGKLPTGMTEFSVQAVDYVTGRTLSDFGTGRVWLEIKQPPTLNLPLKDEQVAYRDPQHIRFQWMPRHQGLANTQYEFTLKMLPDNGAAPQSAFAYGQQMYRTVTRFTTLNYTHLEPLLIPGKRYAWQVRAIAKDGIDEIGMFENNGYSEIAWFELNDNCPAPTQLTAEGGFRKMTVKWKGMPQQRAFLVEYRPKSARNSYDWISTRTFDTSLLIPDLKAGWTYEYRVGALCMTEKPVYSQVKEITLSQNNEAIMQNCGVAPVIDFSNQTPKEDLKVGDVVIVGGDHPMTITELSSQGNGWYSGRGKMHLAWIFDLNIAMKFNHLRINTDNRQIDGTVESETDPNAAKIANTNELDYGGKRTTAGKVEFAVKKLEFTVPETPTAQYNPETEELIVFDTEGKPHAIETKKNEGGSIFPMMIEDEQGNKYQIDAPAENAQPGDNDMAATGGATQQPVITKIEDASSGFNPEVVATDADFSVRFLPGNGKYAFDAGREPWYQTAQLIKQHYLPLENGYIAPWKLIPVGENDVVEAAIEGSGADKKKIKFVLKDGKGVPAREENGAWTLTLPSVKAGETYEVFAVYEEKKGKTAVVGTLNVVSYPKQKHTVTLVPVEAATPDIAWLEAELNRIYTPYGVTITIKVDDSLKGNKEWDLDGDGALNLNGSGFFSKETDEMKALRKLYQRTSPRYDRNAYYIFLTDRAKAGEEPDAGLAVQGDMPRGKQFGYIFMQNAANTPRLIAHELGHGIFTLRHTFEVNYSGDKFKAATPNLMDYNNGTELTVWQWSVMANPAPLTWFDSEDDSKSKINDSDCWNGTKITWTKNTPQLYKGKKDLKYDAASSCTMGANSRVYYRLVNGDVFRETTLYTSFGEIDKIEYAYFLRQLGCWIPVSLDMFETDCLSCDLNKLFGFYLYKDGKNIFFDKNFVEPDIKGVGTISYTYTLDHDIKYPEGWEQNVPILNRPKAEVHTTGTISNEHIDPNGEDKYIITIRVPEYQVYLKDIHYIEYTYEGKLLKPLGETKNWKRSQSLASVALEGLLAGFNAGLAECISAELTIGVNKLVQARKIDFSELKQSGYINPKHVRFSQSSISAKFRDGRSVEELTKGLKEKKILPQAITPIRIVEKDGLIYSLDNRRLKAFKDAGIDIPYVKLDVIPSNQYFKFTTTNQGQSIIIK